MILVHQLPLPRDFYIQMCRSRSKQNIWSEFVWNIDLIAKHIFRYVDQCYALLDACNDEAEPEDKEIYERFVGKSKGIMEESNSCDVYLTYVETMLVTEDIGICGEDLVATYTHWLG